MSLLRDAVNGIGLDLIESQLDMDDYMSQWIESIYNHDFNEAEEFD